MMTGNFFTVNITATVRDCHNALQESLAQGAALSNLLLLATENGSIDHDHLHNAAGLLHGLQERARIAHDRLCELERREA